LCPRLLILLVPVIRTDRADLLELREELIFFLFIRDIEAEGSTFDRKVYAKLKAKLGI
jgi:hypothetical protein